MRRDDARKAYGEAGLLSKRMEVVTLGNMILLRDLINKEMLAAGLMGGTLHMKHANLIRAEAGVCSLRCQAHYFDDREAVTFNPDGFVGFAGWADDENIRPILKGFSAWLKAVATTPQEADTCS